VSRDFYEKGAAATLDLTDAYYFHNIGNMETLTAVVALEALAQESRLGIFRLLVEAGPQGLPAGRIAAGMGLPAATLSFHLSQLRHSGLLACRRDGRALIYSAEYSAMNDLIGFLTDNCCQGNPDKCAPVSSATKAKPKSKRRSK
jgi:ArsR family transcriptional regulator, arsenate/arsenite/antimonite-responsive transcriptional repressor